MRKIIARRATIPLSDFIIDDQSCGRIKSQLNPYIYFYIIHQVSPNFLSKKKILKKQNRQIPQQR